MGRLKVKKVSVKPVLTVRRIAGNGKGNLNFSKLVYIAVANKARKYKFGKSPIVYIGTTARGLVRILESAGVKSEEILSDHGVTKLDFHVVICTSRQRLQSWKLLERALIMRFRDLYGDVPWKNDKLKNSADRKWEQSFAIANLDAILNAVSVRARKI